MCYQSNILISKNIEHHVERHFEINSNQSNFLQYMNCGQEFFKKRLLLTLPIQDTDEFTNTMLTLYGTHNITDEYNYLSNSTFINFFKHNGVDVPKCFSKTYSVLRQNNELPTLKFVHFLMRDGKKLKSQLILQKSIKMFLTHYSQAYLENSNFNLKH